jgi:hypothetical protein
LLSPSYLLKRPRQACCATSAQDQKCWNAAAFEQSHFFDLTECNTGEDGATKGETQEIKYEPAAGLCSVDGIGGHAKRNQFGRSICGLERGSARAFSRHAFLRRAVLQPSWDVPCSAKLKCRSVSPRKVCLAREASPPPPATHLAEFCEQHPHGFGVRSKL